MSESSTTGASTTTAALQELLGRFRAGDGEAKKALVEVAYNRLLILTRGQLRKFPGVRREEETAAILGESYQRLGKALDELRPATVREFFGLAALQIRRVLLDLARQGKRGAEPRPDVIGGLGGPAAGDRAGGGYDPGESDAGANRAGIREDVLGAIDGLTSEEREVVDLLFFNGLSQIEAAELVGVHKDTVKRRWAQARLKLSSLLGAYRPAE